MVTRVSFWALSCAGSYVSSFSNGNVDFLYIFFLFYTCLVFLRGDPYRFHLHELFSP